MKSKIVIGVIVVAVVIAGGWYAFTKTPDNNPATDLDNQSDGLILPDTSLPDISSTTPSSDNQAAPAVIEKDPALKVLAMQIIAKPLVINTTITEAQKEEIIKQIDEIKNKITTNYEIEMPWIDLGNIRKSLKDYSGAIEAFNFLTTIQPNSYLAYHQLGSLYGFEIHDYTKSEENFLKAIQKNTKDIDAYSQLVTVYEVSSPQKIEQLLLDGIKANPNDASLKIMLGHYYTKEGKKEEAVKYLEDALKLNPTNEELKIEIEELKK